MGSRTAVGIHCHSKQLGWFSFLADDYPSQTSIMVPGTFRRWTDPPTLPGQSCKAAVKASAHLRSYLSLKARAWITAGSQQHPKETIPNLDQTESIRQEPEPWDASSHKLLHSC